MGFALPNQYQGQAIGTSIAIHDSTALASLSIQGLAIGTQAYNTTIGAVFVLTVSTASLVTDQVVAVSGITGLRWILQPAFTSANATKLAAVDVFNAGAALTDAALTVNPASDNASEYTLPAATLTANRVLTLGVTGSPVTGSLVQITRRDLTAHTYTVQDDASTSLLVFASAPTTAQGASFRFNGTHFTFSSFFYVAV